MIKEAKDNSKFACSEIVNSQNKSFQLPEPWNGNINAPILFLSSNPGYNPEEDTVTKEWDDQIALDHFEQRLEDTCWPTGTYPAFFNYIKEIASDILDHEANPQEDYCSTEIVHCKSPNEVGVACAATHCVERWLKSLLNISKAKVVVLVGGTSQWYCNKYFKVEIDYGKIVKLNLDDRQFLLTSIYHNNARFKGVGEKKKAALAKIIEQIRSNPNIFQ